MNDFSELENELRKLRPARPSPILFERVEEAMAENCKASVSGAGSIAKFWRFTEWSRGAASDIKGQLVGASERGRASQTPYRIGFALAAAALVLLFASIRMEQKQSKAKDVASISSATKTELTSSNRFIPAGATQVVYNTRDEGLQFADGSEQPLRRLRYQTHQTCQWRNPKSGASLRVSYPSEEVVLIPVSGQ
jgi:hypothetical protein